ncbi:MAG: Sua5 family C-terminal domain-containing protein, partial [Patescibacteria group bacterium]
PLPFFHSRQQLLASEPTSAAAHLYDALRSLDTSTTSQILLQGWPETDQSIALMNRLQKAAASVIEFE